VRYTVHSPKFTGIPRSHVTINAPAKLPQIHPPPTNQFQSKRFFFSLHDLCLEILTSKSILLHHSTKQNTKNQLVCISKIASFFHFLLDLSIERTSLTFSRRCSENGRPQVCRRAPEEEAVRCDALPPPGAMLGSTLKQRTFNQLPVDGTGLLLSILLPCTQLKMAAVEQSPTELNASLMCVSGL